VDARTLALALFTVPQSIPVRPLPVVVDDEIAVLRVIDCVAAKTGRAQP